MAIQRLYICEGFFLISCFRWRKGARNLKSLCFENHAPLEEFYRELIDKTIFEIYQLFFNKSIQQLFIQFSERYTQQKSLHEFKLTKSDIP